MNLNLRRVSVAVVVLVLLLGAAAHSARPSRTAGPSWSVSPAKDVQRGQTVTISGTGCVKAGTPSTNLEVAVNTNFGLLGYVNVATDGSWQMTTTNSPPNGTDVMQLNAGCLDDGGSFASSSATTVFAYSPTLDVTFASGQSGEVIGKGFLRGVHDDLTFNCHTDAGCVSFTYHLVVDASYETVAADPGGLVTFTHFTSVWASADVTAGLNNSWGIGTVVPLITSITLQENWQNLPCLPGQTTQYIPIGPTGLARSAPAADTTASVTTPSGFSSSLWDPKVEVNGFALPFSSAIDDPTPSPLTLIFSFNPASAALSNTCPAPKSGRAPSGSTPRLTTSSASRHPVPRLPPQPPTRFIPRVRIDNVAVRPAVIARAIVFVAAAEHRSTHAIAVRRAATALLVLDSLITVAARHRAPVAPQQLQKLINGLVRDYHRDPAAATAAGLRLAPGQTPHNYFFSHKTIYSAAATRGALWNQIVRTARTPAARHRRLATWLNQELQQHHTRILGLAPFRLPDALPPGL